MSLFVLIIFLNGPQLSPLLINISEEAQVEEQYGAFQSALGAKEFETMRRDASNERGEWELTLMILDFMLSMCTVYTQRSLSALILIGTQTQYIISELTILG